MICYKAERITIWRRKIMRNILILSICFLLIGSAVCGAGDLTVSGNVGVGTTSPGQMLELYKDNADVAIRFHDPGTAVFTMGTDYSDVQKFKINRGAGVGDNPDFVMDVNNGNVGIGTASPGAKLEVAGNLLVKTANPIVDLFDTAGIVDARRFYFYNTGGFVYGRWVNDDNSANVATNIAFKKNGSVAIGGSNPSGYKLYVNGTAYSTGGWSSSDERFKENIEPIQSPLRKVIDLKGISFTWKTEEYKDKGFPDGRHYGVIAQEAEKVLPEVVKEDLDGEKAVAYAEIIPVLIEAVKEQQMQIETLKTEISRLKARN
jgi:hypothetical protein